MWQCRTVTLGTGGVCRYALVQSDLSSSIHSTVFLRGIPPSLHLKDHTHSSNSTCLPSPSVHKQLPSPPPQGSSSLLPPFPQLGRHLTPQQLQLTPSFSPSLLPPEAAASSHRLLRASQHGPQACEPALEEAFGCSDSHSLCCPGKKQLAEWRHWS